MDGGVLLSGILSSLPVGMRGFGAVLTAFS